MQIGSNIPDPELALTEAVSRNVGSLVSVASVFSEGGTVEDPVQAMIFPAVEAAVSRYARHLDAPGHAWAASEAMLHQGGEGDRPYVLAEQPHILALAKPPGWSVSVRYFEEDEPSQPGRQLQEWVSTNLSPLFPIVADSKHCQHGLVHRLDKDTSGIVLTAKTYHGYFRAWLQFVAQKIRKEYICLCHGHLAKAPCFLRAPVLVLQYDEAPGPRAIAKFHELMALTRGLPIDISIKHVYVCEKNAEKRRFLRGPWAARQLGGAAEVCDLEVNSLGNSALEAAQEGAAGQRRRAETSEAGKRAETEVLSVAHLSSPAGDPSSLAWLRLHTGRRHQIRVHMAALGAPLVADPTYGGTRQPWCGRTFLHACRLLIDVGEGPLEAACRLPGDLAAALSELAPSSDRSRALLRAWSRD